jgi:hypothetical protein
MLRQFIDAWKRRFSRRSQSAGSPNQDRPPEKHADGYRWPRPRLSWHGVTDIILRSCGGVVLALWSLTGAFQHLTPHVVELRLAWAKLHHAFTMPLDAAANETAPPTGEPLTDICISPMKGGENGGPPGDRTRDTLIKSQVLYH